jgi:hypothetical protein
VKDLSGIRSSVRGRHALAGRRIGTWQFMPAYVSAFLSAPCQRFLRGIAETVN